MEDNCKDGWWGLDNEESEGENGKKFWMHTVCICTDLVCYMLWMNNATRIL